MVSIVSAAGRALRQGALDAADPATYRSAIMTIGSRLLLLIGPALA
jgi:hypothetical protein